MSRQNIKLVRELADAGNRGDLDALVALLSPDVVWEENPELPGLREVYRGRAEVREWFAEDKIARRQVFWTKDEALEVAGLRE
jgi:ketosteroid isomerase-like protein